MSDIESRAQPETSTVVLSFSPTDSLTESAIRRGTYVRYLRRAHAGPVVENEEWSEFVNCGCGRTRDVSFRVEAVRGDSRIHEGTRLVLEPRES